MKGDWAIEPPMQAQAARGLAAMLLQRPTAPAATLIGMAQMCRRTGALAEARALLDRLLSCEAVPDEAIALSEAFDGRRPATPVVGAVPSPFIRRLGAFTPEAHAALLSGLTARLPQFEAARVDRDPAADASYSRANREAQVIYDLGPLGDIFLKTLHALLNATVYPTFGVDPRSVSGIDVQGTYHGDGAHFSVHSDVDTAGKNKREISFVYYLHAQPKAFSGGDLILFDAKDSQSTYFRDGYTRIVPDDNSLVFFPSSTAHEVQPVSLPAESATRGRLTINGWVRVHG